jgi:hypothetical protein
MHHETQPAPKPEQVINPEGTQSPTPVGGVASGRLRRIRHVLVASAREVVIIVTGILLAFALDAWWDNRQDHRREVEVLRGLAQEFRDVHAELERQATLREAMARTNVATLAALRRAELGSSILLQDTLAQWLVGSFTLDVPQASLQSVISSGRINLIRDHTLRSLLAGWPALVADAQEEWAQDRLIVYEHLIPALGDDLSQVVAATVDTVNSRARRGTGQSIVLTATPQMLNILASRIRLVQLAAIDLARLAAQLERIQENIAAALD